MWKKMTCRLTASFMMWSSLYRGTILKPSRTVNLGKMAGVVGRTYVNNRWDWSPWSRSRLANSVCCRCMTNFKRGGVGWVLIWNQSWKHLLIGLLRHPMFAIKPTIVCDFSPFKSELSTHLPARANALSEAILIRDGIFALSNANHSSINELNYLIESLAIDLN